MSELPPGPVSEQSSAQIDVSPLLKDVLQLFNTRLNDESIHLMQEQLHLLQKSSFYLELQQEEPAWGLIDQQRLLGAMSLANTQVRLLLALFDMLMEEIVCSRQDLEAFLVHCEKGTADAQLVSATQTTLIQVHKYLKEFDTRLSRNMGPLDLDNQLIPSTGLIPAPQLTIFMSYKLPVVFDKHRSHAKSTSVHLFWTLPHGQNEEPNQHYEIQMKIFHPTVGEHGQYNQYVFQSYSCTLENLTPDRLYQFSVKRLDSFNLVYAVWMDTLMLKTYAV